MFFVVAGITLIDKFLDRKNLKIFFTCSITILNVITQVLFSISKCIKGQFIIQNLEGFLECVYSGTNTSTYTKNCMFIRNVFDFLRKLNRVFLHRLT